MFEFTYIKPNVKQVITDLENEPFKMINTQLYTPNNELFMKLNETNAYSTAPNFNLFIDSVKQITNNNANANANSDADDATDDNATKLIFNCKNDTVNKNVDGFIKFSPLLDPVRYLVGKYDISDNNLKNMPSYNEENSHPKMRETDNASYVDSFFSYLSSKMLHEHGFLNALDCYGNMLGLKKCLTMDVVDDLDYLMDNEYFVRNNHILYDMDNQFHNEILNRGSRSRKIAIKIGGSTQDNTNTDASDANDVNHANDANMEIDFELDNIESLDELNIAFEDNQTPKDDVSDVDFINLADLSNSEFIIPTKNKHKKNKKHQNKKNNSTASDDDISDDICDDISDDMVISDSECSSNCSSRTSITGSDESDYESDNNSENGSDDGDESGSDESDGDESGSDDDTDSTASEDKALINIYDFPVNAIFLEKCENTLDYLCDEDEEFGTEELCSALMQVIMTLIAYDKCFDFQHNDLHTNNIMYVPTKKQNLYYKVNNKHYKVPTYGRIFKIIDFGRATYKFRGNQLCSDSFHKDGDAHTQFNFSKHYNSSRPKLEPNGSFDLCRLATSLIDFLIDDLDDLEETKDPVIHMVNEWCQDDNGRNILWKSNGDERYPGFKLYKMIARNVSKHKPIYQLERPILERYKCNRKSIKKGTTIMNIDDLPCYKGA